MSGILKLELKMLYVLLKDIGKRIVASLGQLAMPENGII